MNRLHFTLLLTLAFLLQSCANFKKLGHDLKFMERTTVVSVHLSNTADQGQVLGFVAEWDRDAGRVLSADYTEVSPIGVFSFFVERTPNQFLVAYGDLNQDKVYQPASELAWIYSNEAGEPIPLAFDSSGNSLRFDASLSPSATIPTELVQAMRAFKGEKSFDEAATGWRVPIELGEVADLEDEKFSQERGNAGLWEPASFVMQSGLGVYFLEEYDPERIPVLFIYGATGSPQNWSSFFSDIDRTKYQAWFYYYPTGRRLDEMGNALNRGVELLHDHYQFPRMHVVAHSMGGLVARSFLLHNLADDNDYIDRFVSLSTPWGGHKAVNAGIKMAPSVVPSWYDMQPGSSFLNELFETALKGRIDHLLIYTTKASRSIALPKENDGAISVESATLPAALKDAQEVLSFDEDHVSVLHAEAAINRVYSFLGQDEPGIAQKLP